jgi:hypothetical protein
MARRGLLLYRIQEIASARQGRPNGVYKLMVSLEWHARVRRTPLLRWTIHLKDRIDLFRRQLSKKNEFLCPLEKRQMVLRLLRSHQLHLVVETGTYLGDMADFLAKNGHTVITIELDANLAALARRRFRKSRNVRLVEGDSGALMATIIDQIKSPALFYLDGHYSGPGTAKADCETPVIAEVNAILANAMAGSVVAIDDARCFGTEPGYPPLAEFLRFLNDQAIGDAMVAGDAIVFTISSDRAF